MTSTTDDLPLAADFPPATHEDWRKLVDGVLKGAPFEKLVGKTYDGIRIDPLYPRAKGAAPVVGPRRRAPWQIMQRIDHPDAAQANAQALHDLENGATGLDIRVSPAAPGAHGFGMPMHRETLGAALRWHLSRCRRRASSSIPCPQSREAGDTSRRISSKPAKIDPAASTSASTIDALGTMRGARQCGSPYAWASSNAVRQGDRRPDRTRLQGPVRARRRRPCPRCRRIGSAGTGVRAGARRRLSARDRGAGIALEDAHAPWSMRGSAPMPISS